MVEDELRSAVSVLLEASFADVSVNESGSVMVPFPDNPVCTTCGTRSARRRSAPSRSTRSSG
jgi:hypothetical protein